MRERRPHVEKRENLLKWNLLTTVMYYAFEFDENPSDVVRRFIQHGLSNKQRIGSENPVMTFVNEDGVESPLALHLGCLGMRNRRSELLGIKLDLPKEVEKGVESFAKKNSVNFGQACDSLVEFSLEVFTTMQEHDLYIPTSNGEKISHVDMIRGEEII